METADQIILRIDPRFRGPPGSGNGGYVAGMLATGLGSSDCHVSLRKPPPLDVDLRVEANEDGSLALFDGEALIASAHEAAVDIDAPGAPTLGQAEKAAQGFAGFADHVFPGCFVCGPERELGDGLRIFPGKLDERRVAAPWRTDLSLADAGGAIRPEFLWAALDCAGYFAVEKISGTALLGRIGVAIHALPRAGEPLIVTGWGLGSEGRKHRAGTALHDLDGRLVAAATAIWVSITLP